MAEAIHVIGVGDRVEDVRHGEVGVIDVCGSVIGEVVAVLGQLAIATSA